MPRRNPAPAPEPIARDVRPLPRAPSLEYERKAAKSFLRQIHAGEPDALRRVQATHPVALRERRPDEFRLADAQHVIAREYGFASWPRLVEYFRELERHRHAPRYNSPTEDVADFEQSVRWIVQRHSRGSTFVARELSHYVPRLYGRSAAEILATPITEEDARLVLARQNGRASWDELIALAEESRARMRRSVWDRVSSPLARARAAMRDQGADAVAALLDEHPELLTPSVAEREWRQTLAGLALSFERGARTADARRVTDLLASRGVDIQRELNEKLLGWPQDRWQPEAVRWYLERGADPNWMPSNGITVLEHAIVRYHNGECVDLIARRVTPRRALWIAAGLGDVAGMRKFTAAKGKLTPEGRLNRPDLIAMGATGGILPNLEGDDLEIMWEAFQIAGWNGRWSAMDALLEAGLPVDHAPQGEPLVMHAIGNLRIPLLEYLVGRGADLDREWPSHNGGSARSQARSRVLHTHDPRTADVRRMLELCAAGTVEEILAEREAKRPSPPPLGEWATRVVLLAGDDAGRLGQSAVTTENLLVGVLRFGKGAYAEHVLAAGADMLKLHARIGDRLLPDRDPLVGQGLPADSFAGAALRAAVAEADAHHREVVEPHHLLMGILSAEAGPGACLLCEMGTSYARAREALEFTL